MSYLNRSKTSKQRKNVKSSSGESVHQPNSSSLAHNILRLQHIAGNQATTSLLQQGSGSSSSNAQADLPVQSAPGSSGVPPVVQDVLNSPGQPLDASTRIAMESRFGQDFSQVRIHTDEQAASSARTLDANAYTVGQHIVFDSGRYAPSTARGKTLLAHELTHIVQFARQPAVGPGIAPPHHPSEQEAARVSSRPSSLPVAAPGGIIQRDEKKSEQGIAGEALSAAEKGVEIRKASITAEIEFVKSFLETAKKAIPPENFTKLEQELLEPENTAHFAAGEIAGILQGIVEDVGGLVKALAEMAIKTHAFYRIGSEVHSLAQKGWQGYKEEKKQEYEQVRAIVGQIRDFGQELVKSPQFLVQCGHELGEELGKRSAKWFTEDFMNRTPFYKGHAVGIVIGYSIAEIAMLFVGPEELAVRGGAIAAKAAEGTALGRVVLEALEKIPALAKVLEARKLTRAGSEAVEIGERAGEVAQKAAAPVEKAAAEAGKEARVAEAEGVLPGEAKAATPAESQEALLDKKIAEAEAELNPARQKTLDYQASRAAQGKSLKGGPIKGIWNVKERTWLLRRQKAFPGRTILEQPEIVGVKTSSGTVKPTTSIAGKGRTPDFVEVEGSKAVAGDLKSAGEVKESIAGGTKKPGPVEARFRVSSKVAQQQRVEAQIVEEAKKQEGKLLIKGRNILTGEIETIEVAPSNYSSTVVTYEEVLPN